MIRARNAGVVLVLLLGLAGCATDGAPTPTQTSTTEGDTPVATELRWQEAKARTQAMELEIADSIPQDEVVSIAQMPTGMLIDCGGSMVNWNGAATVTLTPGTEPEPFVRMIEEKYRDSRFDIEVRDPAPAGHYDVQLRSPHAAENYIIKPGSEPSTIRIASGSECFPWPEGESIRGEF